MYMASGHGGQKIFVIPTYSMVVVLTQEVFGNPNGEVHNTAIMSRYILPAVDSQATTNEPHVPLNADLTQYTGTYELSSNVFTIELRQGVLYVSSANAPTMELMAISETRFRGVALNLLDVEFVFNSPEDGKVEGGRVTHGFRNETFVRRRDDGGRR